MQSMQRAFAHLYGEQNRRYARLHQQLEPKMGRDDCDPDSEALVLHAVPPAWTTESAWELKISIRSALFMQAPDAFILGPGNLHTER